MRTESVSLFKAMWEAKLMLYGSFWVRRWFFGGFTSRLTLCWTQRALPSTGYTVVLLFLFQTNDASVY
jgi:hypothetical protein